MDITLYIRELLFGHDCVIVPGFGGFIGNYTAARINKSTGDFSPPVKQISFNKNLNTNDGLLIGRIAGANSIDFNEARTVVTKYVTELRRKLNNGETVIFEHIGAFVNNQEGNAQFEPDGKANYCLSSFGLEPFQCFQLNGYDVRKRIIKPADKDPVKSEHLRKIMWRAAVVVPLLTLMVVAPLKTDLFKSKVETSTLNPLATAEFELNKEAIDKSVLTENIEIPAPVEVSNVSEVSTPVVVKEEIVVPSVHYQIITGSFKLAENAQKQVNELTKRGFTPEIIQTPNGFFRVCAVECSDFETAGLKRNSIISMFPETWILKN